MARGAEEDFLRKMALEPAFEEKYNLIVYKGTSAVAYACNPRTLGGQGRDDLRLGV